MQKQASSNWILDISGQQHGSVPFTVLELIIDKSGLFSWNQETWVRALFE